MPYWLGYLAIQNILDIFINRDYNNSNYVPVNYGSYLTGIMIVKIGWTKQKKLRKYNYFAKLFTKVFYSIDFSSTQAWCIVQH